MPETPLTLFCLVNGFTTSDSFSVKLASNGTVDDLKDLIKDKIPGILEGIDAKDLTIWRVSIPDKDDDDETPIKIDNVPESEKKKLRATNKVSIFGAALPESTIHVIVQPPPRGLSSMRKRHRPQTLMDAIEDAGLAEVAVVDGESDLSRLDNKQRVVLLGCIGQKVDRTDAFYSLSSTAREFQGTNMKDMGKISAPHGTKLPAVNTKELFIREAYKDLHDTILGTFDNARAGNETQKHIVVTGTSGIDNSDFLVYFAIRLLAESDDDNPPIIIFHTQRSAECYVFGGRSTVRSGTIDDIKPFLTKTVISASPKTLFSEAHQYQDVDKGVAWRYYMAPWSLEELTMCRTNVTSFQVVPLEAMEDLYAKIGGVPRYVLERPMKELNLIPDDLESAKAMACERLGQALDRVKDPVKLMQFFAQRDGNT
ncbi:hypothetical protein BGZ96_002590 [Linnemannia gamsii]|uniref:Crinkler effector protein N-terminal domain-containing protein n=1 Tax=Linnemannia gamsii TaxID=64522 RepID=A0ABQ7JKC3_9FUNG|nr:hypothetical protein BGZ96_002590 [Linnemannia gamsii]